ncbi:ISAs1 family transposase [Methylobacterium isbiliense]|uniref:ISAs1 family transposase ISAzs11 n=1 Tax=Methylobacterium isbiliense TaxID=315478 RepID=A0ABQ4SH27_9HYPH|nr:ISAs1 family transposase [Methylobacterium isbiliense]MDN3625780.1 ISAs1 family transposase [Methylobacterium isbiliense]GJE02532.1 ISAs1 family transposase ISAzs11 [Methylobacterium isbiliense]
MLSLITILSAVPDPRTGNATRHDLLDLLVIALTASLCGCESCVDIADFAEDREALFREVLSLPNGLPSHDTFSRLFRLIDPAALSDCFARFLDDLGSEGAGMIAIDGKTLRRSFDRAAGKSALHVVTAFAGEAGLVLGQKAVPEGGNEITAAHALLAIVDIRGMLVTADAIHCQSETARLVLERGGDYLFALKKNRPATHADVETFFADPASEPAETLETTDADHVRLEIRRHDVVHDVGWLLPDDKDPNRPTMPALATLGRIGATVERDGKTTTSTRYYLSSARLSAAAFAKAVRGHWAIENGLHWVLDTAFREDDARARKNHAPENLAIIRKLALNVLRAARPDISIRRKRKRAGWSDAFARSVIGQMR